jgi:raffinose/stachyose/melibiose transport system permease protein
MAKKEKIAASGPKTKYGTILTVLFTIISLLWISPIFVVILNSFKRKAYIFKNPFGISNVPITRGYDRWIKGVEKTFVGFLNYTNAINKTGFFKAFGYSLFITVASVALIVLCCSMCAWYITRVHNKATKVIYLLCLFSMIVPFQMVMFTLSKFANMLHLSNPVGIVIVYLGFGAGLAIFMFTGFVKSIPLEIEEAAMIDGCTPSQAMRNVTIPLMRSSFVQCIFLSITRCFVIYDVNLSLTNGEPFGQSIMAAMHVYNTAFTYKNYGMGQAEALILFIVCAVVGVTQVWVGKKGEVEA